MADVAATWSLRLSYITAEGQGETAPAITVTAPYAQGAQMVGGIDVPDAATASTEYAVNFGTIAEATAIEIYNQTGQDLHVRINGAPASVSGALVSGTKTMALAAVTGEHLSVELVSGSGTPGILSVRRSSGNVIVESWLAGTGIQALDASTVTVWQGGSPNLFRLPDGGALVIAMPALPGGTPLASASVLLTGTQTGAGTVITKVFGDPAD